MITRRGRSSSRKTWISRQCSAHVTADCCELLVTCASLRAAGHPLEDHSKKSSSPFLLSPEYSLTRHREEPQGSAMKAGGNERFPGHAWDSRSHSPGTCEPSLSHPPLDGQHLAYCLENINPRVADDLRLTTLPSFCPTTSCRVVRDHLGPLQAPHALTISVHSICSNPIRRDLPALGGASQQVPLLTSGSCLRSSAFLCPGVHGAERSAKRTRYARCFLRHNVQGRGGHRKGGGRMWGPLWGTHPCTLSSNGFCVYMDK